MRSRNSCQTVSYTHLDVYKRQVELGTEQGNRQLFRLDRLPERETGWLAEHLGGAEEQLVIARFSPEELPLVVVPDRDAELKRRLEDDEADKRISTAALRLARQFTRKLDNRQDVYKRQGADASTTARATGSTCSAWPSANPACTSSASPSPCSTPARPRPG